MPPPAVADQASFAHVAEFFNSLLSLIRVISDYGDSALDVQGAVQSAHY